VAHAVFASGEWLGSTGRVRCGRCGP